MYFWEIDIVSRGGTPCLAASHTVRVSTYITTENSDKKWGFPSSHLFRTWLSFVEKTDTWYIILPLAYFHTQYEYSMTWCHSYEALVFILGSLAQPRALGGLLSAANANFFTTTSYVQLTAYNPPWQESYVPLALGQRQNNSALND